MNVMPREQLVELAFALAHGEVLNPELAVALARVRENAPDRNLLAQYLRLVQGLRQVYAAAPAADPLASFMDDDLLAGYVDGALASADRAQVERVLAQDPYWFNQFLGLAETLREVQEGTGPLEFCIEVLRNGLRFLAQPFEGFSPMQPQPVTLLQAAATELAPAQTVLSWRQTLHGNSFSFQVLFIGGDCVDLSIAITAPSGRPAAGLLTLHREGFLLESKTIPPSGHVRLSGLEPASYQCLVTLDEGPGPISFTITLRRQAATLES